MLTAGVILTLIGLAGLILPRLYRRANRTAAATPPDDAAAVLSAELIRRQGADHAAIFADIHRTVMGAKAGALEDEAARHYHEAALLARPVVEWEEPDEYGWKSNTANIRRAVREYSDPDPANGDSPCAPPSSPSA